MNETAGQQAWSECGQHSDVYYRFISNWITGAPRGPVEPVYKLAMIYDEALDSYLGMLKEMSSTTNVDAEFARALAYKSMLAQDLKFLLPMMSLGRSALRQTKDLALMI